jgi:TPP-dependent pyruvate/acetoin dehydrogenase alpha subunit
MPTPDPIPESSPSAAHETALALYKDMVFVRRFLEKVDGLYRQGQIHGPVHLGLGQEAIAVGAASALRPDDYSIGTYRGHAHALARGTSPEAVHASRKSDEEPSIGGERSMWVRRRSLLGSC